MLFVLLLADAFFSLPLPPPSLLELERSPHQHAHRIAELVAQQSGLETQKHLVWGEVDAVRQLDARLSQVQSSVAEAEEACRQRMRETARYLYPLVARRIEQAKASCRSLLAEVEQKLEACNDELSQGQARMREPILTPLEPALAPRFEQIRLSYQALKEASEQLAVRLAGDGGN